MSFSITDALEDGLGRASDRRSLPLLGAAYLVLLGVDVGTQSQLAAQRDLLEAEPTLFGESFVPPDLPLAVDLPIAVAAALWLGSWILLVAVSMVAIRAYVPAGVANGVDETGRDESASERDGPDRSVDGGTPSGAATVDESPPTETDGSNPFVDGAGEREAGTDVDVGADADAKAKWGRIETDGLLAATTNGVAGGILLSIAITAGLIAFVLPGLFLASALPFTLPYVATARTNVVDAMARSWALTRGRRLRVFGLLVGIWLGYFAISLLGGLAVALLASAPVLGELVAVGVNAFAWLFALAALASAFERLEVLRAEEAEKWAGIDDELLP